MFIYYFCFYFTFTVYTNVLNFHDLKRKEKSSLIEPPPTSPPLRFFPSPLLFQSPQLLLFDIFSHPPLLFQTPSLRDLRVKKKQLVNEMEKLGVHSCFLNTRFCSYQVLNFKKKNMCCKGISYSIVQNSRLATLWKIYILEV